MTAVTKYTLAAVWFLEDKEVESLIRWMNIIKANDWLYQLEEEALSLITELDT